MNVFSNPEILRNARIQLRPRKLAIAAVLCAAISIALGYAYANTADGLGGGFTHNGLLHVILIIQGVVLVIGGGISCLHAVQREKDQNTFDFQRITRLSPLELTLGKLFGAPLMPFFVFLCFIPAAIIGAIYAQTPPTIVFAAYIILILGAIVYNAFALTISLFLRRGAVTWAILFFLAFVGYTSSNGVTSTYMEMGTISPFAAVDLVRVGSWSLSSSTVHVGAQAFSLPNVFHDSFFGAAVHHVPVLILLYLTLLAWLIPAVARNIKRDPENYELYTPAQALGFLCYLNFILFAFFRWYNAGAMPGSMEQRLGPLEDQSVLFSINVLLFFIFGFILLRNRSQLRRALHSTNAASLGQAEFWPAPYLFLGVLIVGVAMVLVISWKRDPSLEWSSAIAIFRIVFFAFWLACDFLFLQWMKLRRAGHPLLIGVLYLGVHYFCAIVVITSLHVEHSPYAAIFLPTPLFVLNTALWSGHQSGWFLALAVQIVAGAVFVFLQRRRLAELRPRSSAPLSAAPAGGVTSL